MLIETENHKFPSHGTLHESIHHFFQSHETEALQIMGAHKDSKITVDISSENTSSGFTIEDGKVRIVTSKDDALRTLAISLTFQWANGVVLIPTLHALIAHGAISEAMLSDSCENENISQIATRTVSGNAALNLGNLWGAFRLLGLQGWLISVGTNQNTCYKFTEIGRATLRLVLANYDKFSLIVGQIGNMADYHAFFNGVEQKAGAMTAYELLVEQSINNWHLLPLETNTFSEKRALKQLQTLLNGLLMGPTMVALGMPLYEKQGDRIIAVRPAIFDTLIDMGYCEISEVEKHANSGFLRSAFRLLEHNDLLTYDSTQTSIKLTESGQVFARVTPPLAALPVSYLKSYERLPDILFGNPDPLGIDDDNHVNRIMNVYGSSGAGSGPASKDICEKILVDLFDNESFDKQPAGISDMGCGDASSLKRLADFVINKTTRGKHLDRYPLIIIGADYNAVSLERARESLAVYAGHTGVKTAVIQADITQPDLYDQAMRTCGISVLDPDTLNERPVALRDLLHTFMFLVHNRKLCVSTDEEAYQIIADSVHRAERVELAKIFSHHFGKSTPIAEHLLLPEILATFRTSYSDKSGLVTGTIQAADLISFMHRWKPYIRHGFLVLEGHSPWDKNLIEDVPQDANKWMKVEKLPHPFNWGMHFLSRQYMMPFQEYILAMYLAGFQPMHKNIFGRIHADNVPGIDLLSQYRFLSIACMLPSDRQPR